MTIICGFVSGTAVEIANTSEIFRYESFTHKNFSMENYKDSFFF